jgi:hypothetical protein
MYDIVCDKFYIQPYWGTIGSMKLNVLQLLPHPSQFIIHSRPTIHCYITYSVDNALIQSVLLPLEKFT